MNEITKLLIFLICIILFMFYVIWRMSKSVEKDIANARNTYYENNTYYEDPPPPPEPRQFHLPCNNCPWVFCKSCPWAKNMTWEEIRRTRFLMMNPPKLSNSDDDTPF